MSPTTTADISIDDLISELLGDDPNPNPNPSPLVGEKSEAATDIRAAVTCATITCAACRSVIPDLTKAIEHAITHSRLCVTCIKRLGVVRPIPKRKTPESDLHSPQDWFWIVDGKLVGEGKKRSGAKKSSSEESHHGRY